MKVISIIVLCVAIALTTWLLVDTVVRVVKRVREKKKAKDSNNIEE